MPVCSEITAVVMAGGKGARFGALSSSRPKCLLRLPGADTLLARLLTQLRAAHIGSVLVCCSGENYQTIESYLRRYCSERGIADADVEAVACASCSAGPLPAFSEALLRVQARWYLLCLADIVFAQGCFAGAVDYLSNSLGLCVPNSKGHCGSLLDGLLITGTDQCRRNGVGSGFVECDRTVVRAISYEPFSGGNSATTEHRRWTGAFLFRNELLLRHGGDLLKHGAAPFETWIQALLQQSARCEWKDGGRFFNINTEADYESLLACWEDGMSFERSTARYSVAGSRMG